MTSITLNWIFVVCLLSHIWGGIFTTEIQVDRIEVLNSTYQKNLYNISELRVTKFNRTTYTINANFILFFDIDEKVTGDISLHYNRFNNNQYNKMPFELKKDTLCNHLSKFYKSFIMDLVNNCTNLLQYAPNEHICPIPSKVSFKECMKSDL